jgi:Phytanoyl-CoA dioxygenase (PhyH)
MLFKDKILQTELEQNGFVIIPFLNADEVKKLNEFYSEVHKGEEPPYFVEEIHMTTWCENENYKKTISENLNAQFENASEKYFQNYRRLNNVFIVKKSGKDTTFKVHQDWSVVDETKYQSVNVWIPLHNVNETSGALWVLKGSHKLNRKIRGAGYLFPDYGNYTVELEKAAISVKLKAGEAIVFYHSVIHGSPPNLSNKNREAACFSVIPKNAPLCIYFQPKEGVNLEVHEPSDDFMFRYKELRKESHMLPPSEKAIKILPSLINKKVELTELNAFLKIKKSIFSFWK